MARPPAARTDDVRNDPVVGRNHHTDTIYAPRMRRNGDIGRLCRCVRRGVLCRSYLCHELLLELIITSNDHMLPVTVLPTLYSRRPLSVGHV